MGFPKDPVLGMGAKRTLCGRLPPRGRQPSGKATSHVTLAASPFPEPGDILGTSSDTRVGWARLIIFTGLTPEPQPFVARKPFKSFFLDESQRLPQPWRSAKREPSHKLALKKKTNLINHNISSSLLNPKTQGPPPRL